MAIEFECPHCKHPYRLKDEFAGRKATCKNPDCRELITIPTPPTAAELEAAALSALADEFPRPEQPVEKPVEKGIPVTCSYCGNNWSEPMAKAGKNTLCPNPECRQRIRVPEPKEETPEDWRQRKTKLPSLAKQAHEKLEGVQDAGEARIVSGEALREADATGEEYEPRPLKQKVAFILVPLALLVGLGLGIHYLINRNTTINDDQLWKDAWADYGKELAPNEAGLSAALLWRGQAEYELQQNTEKKLVEAHDLLCGKAFKQLQKAHPSPVKSLVAAELASAIIGLGGTNEEVKAQTRLPWLPETQDTRLGMGQRPHTIHEEIQKPLSQFLMGADFDFKIVQARRLARELVSKGQAEFAADILPLALFTDSEKDEARAVIALEILRMEPNSDLPHRIAETLKVKIERDSKAKSPNWKPYPASAQTLCGAVGIDFHPLSLPKPNERPSEASRIAFTGKYLLDNQPDQALEMARHGTISDAPAQMRALLLCAEWMPDPTAALDAAAAIVKVKEKPGLSPYVILRLALIGFEKGKQQQAKELAESLSDEGLKAWAYGDGVRVRTLANPKDKAEEEWFEIPSQPDKLRTGHLWGRLWIARQNARLSGDRKAEKKVVSGWQPASLGAFGLAGIAVGLRDH